jgi:hypothetical protein
MIIVMTTTAWIAIAEWLEMTTTRVILVLVYLPIKERVLDLDLMGVIREHQEAFIKLITSTPQIILITTFIGNYEYRDILCTSLSMDKNKFISYVIGCLIYDGQKNLYAFMFSLGLNKLFDKVLTKKTYKFSGGFMKKNHAKVEKKNNLAKIALSALILAASLPAVSQVNAAQETNGILLAGGCAASSKGCAAATKGCGASTTSGTNASGANTYNRTNSNYSGSNYSDPSSNYSRSSSWDGAGSNTGSSSSYNRPSSSWDSTGSNAAGSYNRPSSSWDSSGGTSSSTNSYNRPGSMSDYNSPSSYQGSGSNDPYSSPRGMNANPNSYDTTNRR